MEKTTEQEKEFTVVMRGASSVIFQTNNNILVKDFPSSIGPVNIIYTSRLIKKNNNVSIPGHLWIEIKGKGRNLKDVLTPFANAGLAMLPILSLSANAAIDDPEIQKLYISLVK